jgi:hypothetical protein
VMPLGEHLLCGEPRTRPRRRRGDHARPNVG